MFDFANLWNKPENPFELDGAELLIKQMHENYYYVLDRAERNLTYINSRMLALQEALEFYNLNMTDFLEGDYEKLQQWAQRTSN